KFKTGYMVQRYKGLGEMNAEQLWETTMNPETRTFVRVTIDDLARAERRVTTLMGDKVSPRRKWIEKNVEFGSNEDEKIHENDKSKLKKLKGDKVAKRRKWIENNVEFGMNEDANILDNDKIHT